MQTIATLPASLASRSTRASRFALGGAAPPRARPALRSNGLKCRDRDRFRDKRANDDDVVARAYDHDAYNDPNPRDDEGAMLGAAHQARGNVFTQPFDLNSPAAPPLDAYGRRIDSPLQMPAGEGPGHGPEGGYSVDDTDNFYSEAEQAQKQYRNDLQATRQRYIDKEAAAVQTRDYGTAQTSARILQRLVQIENELLTHETHEVEASYNADYHAADAAKTLKERVLEELYDIQYDRYDPNQYVDGGVNSGAAAASRAVAAASAALHGGTFATVPVRFSLNVKTLFGESVRVCGSLRELGEWNAYEAPDMVYKKTVGDPTEGVGTWDVTLQIQQGSEFKFKFVVVGGLDEEERSRGQQPNMYWQEGDDRMVRLPKDNVFSLDIVVDWEGDPEKEKMWLCMPVPTIKPV
jgi:hypothetical protein